MKQVIFVSGIDTDAGKTYATAHLANLLSAEGHKVITQKFIQTGCTDSSEDIIEHRRLMNTPLADCDIDLTTAPLIFRYPCSAQLAARLENRTIDLSIIENATNRLLKHYDTVLIEGAGGLMVPITDTYFTIDYAVDHQLPIALVTNARLGSINHTVLSLEAIKSRGLRLHSILYNQHFDTDKTIAADTRQFIQRYVDRHFPNAKIIDVPSM